MCVSTHLCEHYLLYCDLQNNQESISVVIWYKDSFTTVDIYIYIYIYIASRGTRIGYTMSIVMSHICDGRDGWWRWFSIVIVLMGFILFI